MSPKQKELITRTIFGSIYAAVMVCAVVLSYNAAVLLFLALTIMAVREFHHLMQSPTAVTAWSIAAAASVYMYHCASDKTQAIWLTVFSLTVMGGLVAELFRKAENPIRNWGNMFLSIGLISLPFALMQGVLAMGDWAVQRYVLLAIFVCIWVNDSGAYCVGSLIGKHKMIPRVSPGKSWEGLVGGFVFSLAAGYIFSLCEPFYSLWQWLLIALTVSVFGTLGDLLESLLKRTIGVKDSGKFLPGHGGVLDRFDSLLLATPAVYILLKLFALL